MGVSYDINNHQLGMTYDANGNQLWDSGQHATAYGWNVENKLVTQTSQGWPGAETWYSYDPFGRRVMKDVNPDPSVYEGGGFTDGAWQFYFYGITGQKLATMTCGYSTDGNQTPGCSPSSDQYNVYFGSRLIEANNALVVTDRLGSVRARGMNSYTQMSYFPYGEERTSTPDGVDKFGTYFRDGPGQDYAQQRYYNNGTGRFWSVDPGGIKTAKPKSPTSWNRYMYVNGDPVNRTDRHGLNVDDDTDGCTDDDSDMPCFSATGYGIGDDDGGGDDGDGYYDSCDFDPFGCGIFVQTPVQSPQKPKKPKKPRPNPCNTANAANAKVINFISAHLTDATSLAAQLSVPVQDILGIAAEESDYGQDYKVPLTNNYFGDHPPAGGGMWAGQVSTYQTSLDGVLATFTTATGFYDSGEVLVNALTGVSGTTSGTAGFVAAASTHGWGTGQSGFAKLATNTIASIAGRLDCVH